MNGYRMLVPLLLAALLVVSGCSPSSQSGKVYSRDQARVAQTVVYGTVTRVEPVRLEGTRSGAGTLAGGALGGALGSGVGSGAGQTIAVVGGAIVGAIAGSATEKGVTEADGLEIEVQLDSGELLAIVQERDEEFQVGERIRVLRDSTGTSRVRH